MTHADELRAAKAKIADPNQAENARLRSELDEEAAAIVELLAAQPIIDAAQAVVDWWTDPTETTPVDLFPALHDALAVIDEEAQP